jgi:glutamate-1-semialdehyde aminotransferase
MSETVTRAGSDAVSAAVDEARARYAARRPRTAALHERAQAFLPGGNTRSVLYHRPFPLRIARAWEAVLEDADGHQYVDLLGEYSAGLYGHSHPVVVKAMTDALHEGISRGAHTRYEIDLAEAVCARFASIERVRFTNSGTEANLMALSAARALGKYIGGGASFGAFGGRADVMDLFDPGRPGALPHAGTFNNNVMSMAAGHAGLTQVYTPQTAEWHTARGDRMRDELARTFRDAGAPFQVTGAGSLIAVHAATAPVRSLSDLDQSDPRLLELLFLDLLERGYYIGPRGYMALSLALTASQLTGFVEAVGQILDARAPLWAPAAYR